ncbi:MAG: ribosome biogenesis GTPase Der [Desulfovibrionaceae bacterium]|nr:ribosome biogenesis GTPase Der [Desulfovibrionaceae bacterium]
MQSTLPQIVLLGRPNVGKSTLFNRLIRSNRAITHDLPGITRDRLEGVVKRNKRPVFTLVDTGGITLDAAGSVSQGSIGFEQAIFEQAKMALQKAAAIALVVDAQDGLMPADEALSLMGRRLSKPMLCIVNKVDGAEQSGRLCAEFHALGLPLLAVSAAHGLNIPTLVDQLTKLVGDVGVSEQASQPLRLAMLGRPNAGKSSLVNALVKSERMIISEEAGTTRDSVDVFVQLDGRDYVFVDTAGVRRKTKITDTVERYSVNSALKSSSKADITLLVVDASEGLGAQDKRLIDLLATRKTPFMLLVNKVDLLHEKALQALKQELKTSLSFCEHVPRLYVSAQKGLGLGQILKLAWELKRECSVRVPTGKLNRAMETVLQSHQPPLVKNARPKFFYMTQAESEPPTFVFFVSDPTRILPSYLRYLERSLRKLFNIKYAPVRMHLRASHNTTKPAEA